MNLQTEMYFEEGQTTTLAEIEKLANMLLAETWCIDIYRSREAQLINLADRGWTFEFNTRKRAAGLCNYTNKTIYVSKWLLNQNLHKALNFENTLRHELAHALDGAMGGRNHHNKVWKAIARQVLCTAERCYSSDEIQIVETTKYTLVCPSCGKEKASHKKNKRKSACYDCCTNHNFGRYSEEYVMVQIQNY